MNYQNNQSSKQNPSQPPDQLRSYFQLRPPGASNHDLSLFNDQSRAFLQQNPIIANPTNHLQSVFNNASNVRSWNASSRNNYSEIENLKYDDDEQLLSIQEGSLQSDQEKLDIDLDKITHLSLKIKRKIITSSSFHEQILPFVVSLGVDEKESQRRPPLDLVCVIDHSGSMSGTKIELVKNTFNYLLKYLNVQDRLSVITFDDQASRLFPLIATSQQNKGKIQAALRGVRGRGGTDINLGMMHAFQVLNQRRHKNPVTSIFLLSDGLDKGAENKIKDSLSKFRIGEDLTINTFGFGRDHDPELMINISNQRDGNFYFIDKLDSIDEAFIDCLGGLLSSVAQSAKITIQAQQTGVLNDVKITKAYGEETMWQRENQSYIVNINPLISGRHKDYVLEIQIPITNKELLDHEKNIQIASAEAVIIGFNGEKITKKAELHITLLNEIEGAPEQEEDDLDVMRNLYRVKGSVLMDEARKLADQNCHEEAKKLLQNFREEIANSLLKEEAYVKHMITDIDATIKDLNPIVYHATGRQMIWNNQRSQMQQRSNVTMANSNMNFMQQTMQCELQGLKQKKSS